MCITQEDRVRWIAAKEKYRQLICKFGPYPRIRDNRLYNSFVHTHGDIVPPETYIEVPIDETLTLVIDKGNGGYIVGKKDLVVKDVNNVVYVLPKDLKLRPSEYTKALTIMKDAKELNQEYYKAIRTLGMYILLANKFAGKIK